MTELTDVIQDTALDAFGPRDQLPSRLGALRPALRDLRSRYTSSDPPDFASYATRWAYAFAYHPHHATIAAAVFGAAGPTLLGLNKLEVNALFLGAGAGADLVGLAHFAQAHLPRMKKINAHLVDRERGWAATRQVTLGASMPRLWSGELDLRESWVDLNTKDGLSAITADLRAADIVVAQTLITELANPLGDGALVDCLVDHVGPNGRILIVDLSYVRSFHSVTAHLDAVQGAVTLLRAQDELAAARPAAALTDHLFAREDGLWPRRDLKVRAQLLARPGVKLDDAPLIQAPTPSQAAALEEFRDFMRGDNRAFVLRGPAGTGKTTLIAELIRAVDVGTPIKPLAPTGQAARRLGHRLARAGSTIHSEVYAFDKTEPREEEDDLPLTCFAPSEPPGEAALYIVDEASLVGDKGTAERSDQEEVRFGEGRLLTDLVRHALTAPGSRLVFVGDDGQLPPVGEQTSPALNARALEDVIGRPVVVTELSGVVRQAEGSAILALANHQRTHPDSLVTINEDQAAGVCVLPRAELPPWLVEDVAGGSAVIVAFRNADVGSWNTIIRQRAGRSAGKDGTPAPGDRLLVVRSSSLHRAINGDELVVADVGERPIHVTIREETVRLRRVGLQRQVAGVGAVTSDALIVEDLLEQATREDHHRVSRVLFRDFVRRTKLRPGNPQFGGAYASDDKVQALRATYSYARTCHRAQGGEWENVVIDMTGVAQLGPMRGPWLYTALTRARRAVWFVNRQGARSSWTLEQLREAAAARVQKRGLQIVDARDIQTAVQLTVSDGQATTSVNVYAKKGLPSRVTPTGPANAPELAQLAIHLIEEWIEEARVASRPPPLEVLTHCTSLIDALTNSGYDVQLESPADYQVTVHIRSRGAHAAITYHHGGNGALRSERSAEGELQLLEALRIHVEGELDA